MNKKTPKVGRPSKTDATKKSAKIFVNLTIKEKEKLEKYALEQNLSLSQVCYKALKEKKFI